MVNFDKFSSENTVIFDDFSPKITLVRPKCVPQGLYSRGGSIDADTVYNCCLKIESSGRNFETKLEFKVCVA